MNLSPHFTLEEMLHIAPQPTFDNNGMMQSGVIVRHLVLPGCRKDSQDILSYLTESFGTKAFILSLMSQFTPNGKLESFPEIDRPITTFEYNSVVNYALALGFDNAYIQEKSSAKPEYTPPFDLTGI